MYKLFVLILTILVFSIASCEAVVATGCKQLKCAPLGGSCGSNSTTSNTVCPSTQYCKNGVCTNRLSQDYVCVLGGPSNQCGASLTCQMNNAVPACLPSVYQANPGESCKTNAQCYYRNTTTQTTSSTCVGGKCFGKMINEQCDSMGQCVTGLYCSQAGMCAGLLANGGNCSSPLECASGSCIPQSINSSYKSCSRFQSVLSGGACASNLDCADGLYCNTPAVGNKWGVCSAAFASSHKACTTSSDCSYPETCVCNSLSGMSECTAPSARPVGVLVAELSSFNCSMANNCTSSSCMLAKCPTELCSYYSTMFGPSVWNSNIVNLQCIYGETAASAYSTCYGNSVADEINEHSNDALLLLPALVVIAIMVVVVLAM